MDPQAWQPFIPLSSLQMSLNAENAVYHFHSLSSSYW